ncbi:helix-turn-helix domain-containing protein [Streptomyces parvus]|uniref:Helix-turn-helix domain-containing protein n=1 Tax=Streptomyces parvus TaxID=66428 RepID=A0A7K3RS07_9ACTN|nr:helix-turn-helix domain-containing protein [Streptomyces parvus]
MTEAVTTCTSTIHDGHETVQCVLKPHPPEEDHRRGFLAWDSEGNWYARRDFPPIYPTIGNTLRGRRQQLGLTQQQVAKALDISRSSVAQIELGTQHLSLHLWVAMCQTLGADPASVISCALQGTGPSAPAEEAR